LQDGFGKSDDMPVPNEASLWRAVLADKQCERPPGYTFDCAGIEPNELRAIRPGKAIGPLTGGNLSVLAGTIGTPFEFETAGRILFLEDVGERLYRIDRYLAQLWLAGKLQAAAGVVLGSFSYDVELAEPADAVAELLSEYFSRLAVPVLAGFPAGHTRYNLTLPIGAIAELDAGDKRLTVCENAVAVGSG
jgi:muramoyltetrapeptide carboxypeptidase